MELINLLFRWAHVLFGVAWIGLLYYFNFIQGGYFKQASAEGLADAKAKLAPSALWWFRWAAMFTFITGVILIENVIRAGYTNPYIIVGALMGTLMFINVWLIIWPNQKVALGMIEGDAAVAGAKALLASRTNTLFSAGMLLGMLGSQHGQSLANVSHAVANTGYSTGLWLAMAIIAALEVNAVVGKMGPMTSVVGVIHSSIVLTVIIFGAIAFL